MTNMSEEMNTSLIDALTARAERAEAELNNLKLCYSILERERDSMVKERNEWKTRSEEAEANYQFMVDRAINEKLDGYRELGARAAAAENARDLILFRLQSIEEAARNVVNAHDKQHTRLSGYSVLDAAVSTLRAKLDTKDPYD